MSSQEDLPSAANEVATRFPQVWSAFSDLGEAVSEAGPLTARERRLIKLALAIGAESEGAVHSHVRRAEADGVEPEALEQVALMAIPTLGLPRAAAALSWIGDLTGRP